MLKLSGDSKSWPGPFWHVRIQSQIWRVEEVPHCSEEADIGIAPMWPVLLKVPKWRLDKGSNLRNMHTISTALPVVSDICFLSACQVVWHWLEFTIYICTLHSNYECRIPRSSQVLFPFVVMKGSLSPMDLSWSWGLVRSQLTMVPPNSSWCVTYGSWL